MSTNLEFKYTICLGKRSLGPLLRTPTNERNKSWIIDIMVALEKFRSACNKLVKNEEIRPINFEPLENAEQALAETFRQSGKNKDILSATDHLVKTIQELIKKELGHFILEKILTKDTINQQKNKHLKTSTEEHLISHF